MEYEIINLRVVKNAGLQGEIHYDNEAFGKVMFTYYPPDSIDWYLEIPISKILQKYNHSVIEIEEYLEGIDELREYFEDFDEFGKLEKGEIIVTKQNGIVWKYHTKYQCFYGDLKYSKGDFQLRIYKHEAFYGDKNGMDVDLQIAKELRSK